jgi:chemotaxis response regulator CheB
VEDYKPWQELICSLIEGADGIRLVGIASDGLAAVQNAKELQSECGLYR